MDSVENLLGDINPFLVKVSTFLEKDGIDVSNYKLDHICYRVETPNKYEELKQKLLSYGPL